jgi:hypothetical protein
MLILMLILICSERKKYFFFGSKAVADIYLPMLLELLLDFGFIAIPGTRAQRKKE